MSTYNTRTGSDLNDVAATPIWARIALGIVLIISGVIVLGDVVLATVVSAKIIGAFAVIAGAFEILHAFWNKGGWGGFLWHILLGLLYIAFGVALFTQPVAGALALTYFLGFMLVFSGIIRVILSFKLWQEAGWIMLISGLLGIVAGIVILSGFPATGLWVIGFVLGVDLIFHGLAWIIYALAPGNRTALQRP